MQPRGDRSNPTICAGMEGYQEHEQPLYNEGRHQALDVKVTSKNNTKA